MFNTAIQAEKLIKTYSGFSCIPVVMEEGLKLMSFIYKLDVKQKKRDLIDKLRKIH